MLGQRLLALRSGWRSVSTGTQAVKAGSEVKNLFLKKIKEYGSKFSGKGEDFFKDATPEMQRSLDDQLQRLACKYHLENTEAVKGLPVKGRLEKAEIESAVSVMLEPKTLNELQKSVKDETEQYIEMRRLKEAEEEALAAQLRSTTEQHSQLPPGQKK